jgi:stage II sporulation protein D
MSQNGAQAMAKAGKSYKQILELFYDGTEVAEIDEVS